MDSLVENPIRKTTMALGIRADKAWNFGQDLFPIWVYAIHLSLDAKKAELKYDPTFLYNILKPFAKALFFSFSPSFLSSFLDQLAIFCFLLFGYRSSSWCVGFLVYLCRAQLETFRSRQPPTVNIAQQSVFSPANLLSLSKKSTLLFFLGHTKPSFYSTRVYGYNKVARLNGHPVIPVGKCRPVLGR